MRIISIFKISLRRGHPTPSFEYRIKWNKKSGTNTFNYTYGDP